MKAISALVLCAALLAPGSAFAGWGAIAYNSYSGASSESHGYGSLGAAENAALGACSGRCRIMNWEQNSCIAFATNGAGAWGEAHGYPNSDAAVAAAISACGGGCSWREWACN
jgi:hypothetical protein